jgi:hypothetical protein
VTQGAPFARPPRLAAWVVDLFASASQAQAILGDLAEEFADMSSQSGVLSARRWYWRQSLETIAHLAGAALRVAPWSLVGIVVLGFLLRWFSVTLPEPVVVAILRTQRPYSNLHYNLYVQLLAYGFPLVGMLVLMLIGCITAALAKGREIVATAALAFLAAAHLVLLFLTTLEPWSLFAYSWPFVIMQFAELLGIILGGVTVREVRSVLARRFS